ncbi:MAG: hypothetical protein K2I72_01440, partial [Bacilli bacterium]|nr:hypothetical protein [Bacilli bacterium]
MKINNLKYYGAILGCIPLILLSGCGKKEYYLEKSILDQAFIATVDGEDCFLKIHGDHLYPNNPEWNHKHYRDVISGEIYTDSSHCEAINIRKVNEITGFKNLTSRMSPDEMQKAAEGCSLDTSAGARGVGGG